MCVWRCVGWARLDFGKAYRVNHVVALELGDELLAANGVVAPAFHNERREIRLIALNGPLPVGHKIRQSYLTLVFRSIFEARDGDFRGYVDWQGGNRVGRRLRHSIQEAAGLNDSLLWQ